MKKLKDGWMLETVGELFDIQLGKMLNQKAIELSPKYPYLGNSNVRWGTFDLENLKTMHFSEKEINKFSLQKNDILMCEGGEVGRCAIWENESREIYYQKALHRLRSKGKILPRYFYHYIAFIAGTKLLDDQTTKTSIAHLTREKLSALKIPVPPLEEQIQIAETLSTWDNAIQTTEKLLENSRRQKKALMQRLLGDEKRKNWKKVLVSEICNIGRGRVISKKEIEENQGIYPVYSSQTSDNGIMGYLNSFDFNGEYVTWTTDGVNAGTVFYRNGKFNCTNVCGVLSSKIAELDLKFLAYILSTETYKYVSHTLANPKLMNGIMGSIELELPVIEKQQKIAEIISTADQEIETLQRKLECLKLEKGALMQRLL